MGEDAIEPATAELLGLIAREIESGLDARTSEMAGELAELIPELRSDHGDMRELLAASVSSNLATVVHTLTHDIPVDLVELPTAASYYARRQAQRDVPLEALLRAYRLGHKRFSQWWFHALERHSLGPSVILAASRYVATVTASYIDRVSIDLVRVYDEERRLWSQRASSARRVQIRTVLSDGDLDSAAAEDVIGYRMDRNHLAMVAWTPPAQNGNGASSMIQVVTEVSVASPLAVLVDDHTLWAWLSAPPSSSFNVAGMASALTEAIERRAVPMRVALGSPARDLAGFRSSHDEAVRAQRVATIRGDGGCTVTLFADVVLATFLATDLRTTRRWLASVMGRLALDDGPMAELRRTVLVYLEAGSSLIAAAELLHLHKNTVRYRLRKAEDARGAPLSYRRTDLELALATCRHLGRTVLVQTAL